MEKKKTDVNTILSKSMKSNANVKTASHRSKVSKIKFALDRTCDKNTIVHGKLYFAINL